MTTHGQQRRVGIDFGTSTTLVADRDPGGAPSCIALGRVGADWIPTLVGLDEENRFLVGDDALGLPAAQVISSVKAAVTEGRQWIEVRDATGKLHAVSADEVITWLLSQVRARLVGFEPSFFDDSLVNMACPAAWRTDQRERLVNASVKAGIDISLDRIHDEPVAAGTAFLQHHTYAETPIADGWIVVVDAGGGTLDLAVLECSSGELTTLVTDGNALAGDAIDTLIAAELAIQAPAPARWIDPHSADTREALLRRSARELKEILTTSNFAERPLFGSPTVLTLERAQFETMLGPLLSDLADVVERSVRKASEADDSADWAEVAERVVAVQLAGGTTRVPAVHAQLETLFPHATVGPDPMLRQHEAAVVAGLTYL